MSDSLFAFLADIERLKLVHRRAYLSDLSRHENSAEHSWHLALGLLTVARELNLQFDLLKALKIALGAHPTQVARPSSQGRRPGPQYSSPTPTAPASP